MPWVRFDDQFPIHRKVKALSDSAFRLHVEAIFWCARNLTDGFVPAEDVSDVTTVRRPHKFIDLLVTRGSWLRVDGGWQIHDYLDYQPAKAKVEEDRKAKSERQARWLAGKKSRSKGVDASLDASRDAAPYPPRTRPEGRRYGERASPTARSPVPVHNSPWCGECGDSNRMVEDDDGRLSHCPTCHPSRSTA